MNHNDNYLGMAKTQYDRDDPLHDFVLIQLDHDDPLHEIYTARLNGD